VTDGTDSRRDGPGVKLPPPFLYLTSFLVGIVLQHALPIPAPLPLPLGRFLGWLLAVVSLVVAALGVRSLRAAGTTIRTDKPASMLVTVGIFGRTRNPLYLSLLLLYAGISVFLNLWWPVVLLPLLVLTMNRFVIAKEEAYLVGEFGAAYREYTQRVRRWM